MLSLSANNTHCLSNFQHSLRRVQEKSEVAAGGLVSAVRSMADRCRPPPRLTDFFNRRRRDVAINTPPPLAVGLMRLVCSGSQKLHVHRSAPIQSSAQHNKTNCLHSTRKVKKQKFFFSGIQGGAPMWPRQSLPVENTINLRTPLSREFFVLQKQTIRYDAI